MAVDDDRLVSPRLQFGQPGWELLHRNEQRSIDVSNGIFVGRPAVEKQETAWGIGCRCVLEPNRCCRSRFFQRWGCSHTTQNTKKGGRRITSSAARIFTQRTRVSTNKTSKLWRLIFADRIRTVPGTQSHINTRSNVGGEELHMSVDKKMANNTSGMIARRTKVEIIR